MITLTRCEQELIIKYKDLFEQGKMDEFWRSFSSTEQCIITQFLRQYFSDEYLIHTYVPARFFYFDKNPVWIDGVTECGYQSYNTKAIIPQNVDLSNYKGDYRDLPCFQHFVINDKAINSTLVFNTEWQKKHKRHINITDTTISITGEYNPGSKSNVCDFSKITNPDILLNIYFILGNTVFYDFNYCIFPDLPTVYLPETKGWFNPILEADEIEFGKNTVDIKFSNVRSELIKVKKFIVHNRKVYKIISDAIKYKHLNSTVELV